MKMTKKYRQAVHTFLQDSIWLHVFYKKHTCREVIPGLDAPRVPGSFTNLPSWAIDVSSENFQPPELSASNPVLTEPASVFRFYLMPLRLKCTEDFTLYSI